MSLILSGTDGVSDIDGTAATPAIRGTDANTGIFFPAADTIAFAEGGAESMRIDSSGRVGIGTTSPSTNLTIGNGGGGNNLGVLLSLGARTNFYEAYDGTKTMIAGVDNTQDFIKIGSLSSHSVGFVTGNAERMRIDSSGNVGIGTSSPSSFGKLAIRGGITVNAGTTSITGTGFSTSDAINSTFFINHTSGCVNLIADTALTFWGASGSGVAERMRIDSSGRVGIGTTSMSSYAPGNLSSALSGDNYVTLQAGTSSASGINMVDSATSSAVGLIRYQHASDTMDFFTAGSQRVVITSGGDFLVGTTNSSPAVNNVAGASLRSIGIAEVSADGNPALFVNRKTSDGGLVSFRQDGTEEGTISVSGNTVSYNGFSGGHWTQLPEGRGYNPEILRGTVMSSIGDMCEWKSVVWDEVIEHPAVPAVEAKEAVLDEEGNVIEPAVDAVEGKDAWTETFNKREAYLGQLPVGATFEEDGVTKTVVDDGNERLPKVKISDVVGDKAVYGVFQTWDEVQDMLVTSLGAFVVRIASGVTVQIGDLLESNGDGCAKVQDDDVIRSRTIGKVTSTTPSATYADGSYTVPAVLYCG